MNIEQDYFKRSHTNIDKLIEYGFTKKDDEYKFEKNFLNNEFKAVVIIKNNLISGKVIDLSLDEEYTNIRREMTGEFVNNVREEYKKVLKDIKDKCFINDYFIMEQSNRITNYIIEKYNSEPEFLWESSKGHGVFRNKNNNKWFGIIMNIDKSKLDKEKKEIEIINLKIDENKIPNLLKKNGYYKAYHMNKKSWVTITLDDTLKDEEIISLIDESFNNVNTSEEWLIPANPEYYDMINCFNDTEEIIWKQNSNINKNDIIYLYVGNPYSKIFYKCIVKETDIPYEYQDENLKIKYVMKIKLLKNLIDKNYTFGYLKELGIKMVRGQRKIRKEISAKLK